MEFIITHDPLIKAPLIKISEMKCDFSNGGKIKSE
jgi:hypothetical protein